MIALVLVLAGGAFALNSLLGSNETVAMPNVVGKQLEEATTELDALEIDYTIEYKTNEELGDDEEYEENEVVEQSVNAGTEIEVGKQVRLTVCSGDGPIEVPNVLGESSATAKSVLVNAGLNVIVEEQESDETEDRVLEQSLDPGSEAEKGDTITIVVSVAAKVTVPNLDGLSLDDARSELEKKGLALGSVKQENSDSYSPEQVMEQSIDPGSEVEKGTSVNVVVSSGPAVKTTTVNLNYTLPADDETHSVQIVVTDETGTRTVSSGSGYRGGDSISQAVTITGSGVAEIVVDGTTVYSREV